jgi:hypothetical protein
MSVGAAEAAMLPLLQEQGQECLAWAKRRAGSEGDRNRQRLAIRHTARTFARNAEVNHERRAVLAVALSPLRVDEPRAA